MTALSDYQFEILPDESSADGFVFGLGAQVAVNPDGFDPGEVSWITQDSSNTRRGINAFGRDIPGARTWSWEGFLDGEDDIDALAIAEAFSSAWMPEELVKTPGALVPLRYRLAGRDRRIFGRPRRLSIPPTNLILNGYSDTSFDFQLVDGFSYDDLESSVNVPYSSSASGGGVTLPVVLPALLGASTGSGVSQISVLGNRRTYPIIRFNGPWTNPVINFGIWSLAWNGSIPSGQWVEIDCRPWKLSVLNQSGASVVDGLPPSMFLEDCYFPPNTQPQVALAGSAPGGGASALVRWRNSWKSL